MQEMIMIGNVGWNEEIWDTLRRRSLTRRDGYCVFLESYVRIFVQENITPASAAPKLMGILLSAYAALRNWVSVTIPLRTCRLLSPHGTRQLDGCTL